MNCITGIVYSVCTIPDNNIIPLAIHRLLKDISLFGLNIAINSFEHLMDIKAKKDIKDMNVNKYTYPLNASEKILTPLVNDKTILNTLSANRITK